MHARQAAGPRCLPVWDREAGNLVAIEDEDAIGLTVEDATAPVEADSSDSIVCLEGENGHLRTRTDRIRVCPAAYSFVTRELTSPVVDESVSCEEGDESVRLSVVDRV